MIKLPKWVRSYYWSVVYDYSRDIRRSNVDKIKWVFLWPWYGFLRTLAKSGFLNTPENSYMRIRDFTPFFWKTLINRAVAKERKEWERKFQEQEHATRILIEEARRTASEEVWEYLNNKINEDFGIRSTND